MLQGDFYTILSAEHTTPESNPDGRQTFLLKVGLNPDHRIYAGHFPGNPVVPGVCQIGMVKEAVEHVKGLNGLLQTAETVKFLQPVIPSECPVLTLELTLRQPEEHTIVCQAVIRDEAVIFLKFRGTLCTKPI